MTIRHFAERVNGFTPTLLAELDFDERQKAQNRVLTNAGEAVGIFIERGTSLAHGDQLRASDGTVLGIEAKPERLSVIAAALPRDLTRAAYHLGNRHVRLEIGPTFLAYQEDHVLDDMVRTLGFEVNHDVRPFEPEGGAYHRGHSHGNDHGHDHGADHEHTHGQDHGHAHGAHSFVFKVGR